MANAPELLFGTDDDTTIQELLGFNRQFFDETGELRGTLLDALTGDIGQIGTPITQENVAQNPLFPVLQGAASDRFSQAQDQILSNLPRGGVAQQALADAAIGRADALTQGQAAIGENIANQRRNALNVGANVATAPLQLAPVQASLATTQAELDEAKLSDLAEGGASIADILANK